MKIKFLCCLFILSFFSTYGQTVISGVVYKDSTMTETISNVKIVFKSDKKRTTNHVKTDCSGFFTLLIDSRDDEYTIIIKKKNYIPIRIESFSLADKSSKLYLKLVLKKMLSVHDENYEGPSKLISVEQ